MNKQSKIYVAGHRGLVGSAIVRHLDQAGFSNLVTRTSAELDLRDQNAVRDFFSIEKPDFVFLAAAKVGGIMANNTYPADFLYDNLAIQNNVIHQSYLNGVKKLLFLGSSCIYPKLAPQPIREDYLLTDLLESTNEPYAIAKIAGIKLCQAYNRQYGTQYISLMPTNLYGPNDNFDLQKSHVLPALIRKFHEARENGAETVEIWGTGSPLREFLHVDDLADASLFMMENYNGNDFFNVGVGKDISIKDLALLIRDIVDFRGELVFDISKPDGTPRKLLDVSKLTEIGWQAKIGLREGISATYEWYLGQLKPVSVL